MRLDRFALRALFSCALIAAAAHLPAQAASLPPPRNLKAELSIECRKNFVRLSWDAKRPEDGAIAGYRIYDDRRNPGRLAVEAELPLFRAPSCDFEVTGNGGVDMRFAVAAVSAAGVEGPLSETVTVALPTFRLPGRPRRHPLLEVSRRDTRPGRVPALPARYAHQVSLARPAAVDLSPASGRHRLVRDRSGHEAGLREPPLAAARDRAAPGGDAAVNRLRPGPLLRSSIAPRFR